jgi:hypothetical protein
MAYIAYDLLRRNPRGGWSVKLGIALLARGVALLIISIPFRAFKK